MHPVLKIAASHPTPRALSRLVSPNWTRVRGRPAAADVPQPAKPTARFHGVCGGFV